LDVLHGLVEKYDIQREDVEEINVGPALGMLMTYRARGTMDAAFSLAYMLAVSLFESNPGFGWYTDEIMHNPKVIEMTKRIKKAEGALDADLNHEFRNYWKGFWMPVQVEVVLKGGKRFMGHATYPKGHPSNPLTDEEFEKKFAYASRCVLKEDRVKQVVKLVEKLETIPDISELVNIIH
jgi:2-methylcitrate dehydratase